MRRHTRYESVSIRSPPYTSRTRSRIGSGTSASQLPPERIRARTPLAEMCSHSDTGSGPHAISKRLRRLERAPARRHQEAKSREHGIDCARLSVVPGEDALGGVAATDEPEIDAAVVLTAFAGNLAEQPALRDRDRYSPLLPHCQLEHRESLVERRPCVGFMGEAFRDHHQNFIDRPERGLGERKVRPRGRVERARKNSEPLRLNRGFAH